MNRFLTLVFVSLLNTLAFSQQFAPRYELVNLGKQVNTFYHEAAPVISPDGKTLYFFVQNHPENTYGKEGSQDIWITTKDDKGAWSAPRRAGSPFNNSRSNQVFNVLADGTLFIRGGRSKNEKGFSLVNNGSLTELKVKDFEEMEKGRFYGATISSDAKHIIIYFSELGNAVRSDLYISHAQTDGGWSRPVKLKLSSSADEFGCFMAPDNKTLYFASDRNGANKQGGSDIYKTERLDDSWENWSEPVNLGRPINTAANDSYIALDNVGNVFTSRANSRIDGGNLDIFVLIPKDIKVKVIGTVLNQKNNQPISGSNVVLTIKDVKPYKFKTTANGKFETRIPETDQYLVSASADNFLPGEQTFTIPKLGSDTTLTAEIFLTPIAKKLVVAGTLFNKKTEEAIGGKVDLVLKSNRKSNFKVDAPGGKYEQEISEPGWYVLTGSADGYLNGVDSVKVNSEEETPVIKDLYLQKIEVGVTVRLKNIYFDYDKTTLKSASFVELNKVVEILKQNGHVEIEIAGHTDSHGSDTYNLTLSQGRSQAVVDYLISQGIESFRLKAHGYGESKPIDTNDTDAGAANNRRVEFTVLKN
jgi:OOP family OmpA-OmpF porin